MFWNSGNAKIDIGFGSLLNSELLEAFIRKVSAYLKYFLVKNFDFGKELEFSVGNYIEKRVGFDV